MSSAREINSANLVQIDGMQRFREAQIRFWDYLSSSEPVILEGYNPVRGTHTYKSITGGDVERRYLGGEMKPKGSVSANIKPLRSMTGFSL